MQNSFLLHQHLVAVFFDLEKVYDIAWRYGTLGTLAVESEGTAATVHFKLSPGPLFPSPSQECFICT
jgi:hypothetical protein